MAADVSAQRRDDLFELQRPFSAVQWTTLAGGLALLFWSVPGLFVNPDFAVGDSATAERVMGVDMNGWHALSGILLGLPAVLLAPRPRLAASFALAAGGGLVASALWALATPRVAGLFYLPNQTADALLHLATAAVLLAGAVPYLLARRASR